VPTGQSTLSNFFQRTPVYHSGEPTTMNNPWNRTATSTAVTWATPDTFSTAAPWGSALRWSTAATFSFTSDQAPTTGPASLTFFKPGSAGSPATLSLGGLPVPSCRADFNGDNSVDLFDYLDFVNAFSTGSASADYNHDNTVDVFDYLDFVNGFTTGC